MCNPRAGPPTGATAIIRFGCSTTISFRSCIKPSPDDFQELYLGSLRHLGFDPLTHDIRFVEDNWESPTLGAWGLGWEVWLNGMEVSQFTYFQQVGGLDCRPVMGEITYGLERLAMYIQGKESIFDIVWTDGPFGTVTYGDVFHQNEVEQSIYNFEKADTRCCRRSSTRMRPPAGGLLEDKLVLPAYEQMVKASHASICWMRGTRSPSPSGSDSFFACAPWRAGWRKPTAPAARRWAFRCSSTPPPKPRVRLPSRSSDEHPRIAVRAGLARSCRRARCRNCRPP